ncbi:MAG TPA: S8 family serine peptidase [Streptosporangiaceae bacterium]|nr:S8 family serine peptidase [Streptosporangiaceae bacterium]
MKCFIEPRRDNSQDEHSEADSEPGLAALPESLLLRHGAIVLNPAAAVSIPGWPAPRPAVYRARNLLVPGELLAGPQLDAINAVLARVGMKLVAPLIPEEAHGKGISTRTWMRLPRPAVLTPARRDHAAAGFPVVIDAWVALQMLRAAADAHEPGLDKQAVSRIALEHLLIGAAITGSPITEGGGLSYSAPNGGGTGSAATDSYLFSGGDGRSPVEVCMEAPDWSTTERCAREYGRRAVVAVLDTGVRAHSWLGVHADPAAPGGYSADGFVEVSQGLQDIIRLQGAAVTSAGDSLRQLIAYPWDRPVTAEPLVGELDTHTGHGTFIAGIVRQVAPPAQVLSLRIMHSDGIVYEGDLICALSLLADRVASAVLGDLAGMIDLVCLSLGYFSESAADVTYSSGLREVIDMLLGLGVAVIAAAGNYATSRRFYPAAFAARSPAGQVPLISVGALNPNGSKALFSDGGRWVTAWASGAALISTFPQDINGSRAPEIRMRAHPANELPATRSLPAAREALDPDDYSGGFAVWSGTSFAAPLLAARVASSLIRAAARPGSGLRLDVKGTAAAEQRVVAALEELGW